ncbi:Peptidoglycan/LPS O-acetylase OafA/YrhL, contains acyltransferase and SGNH-hydrolase domains [Chitinophaga sp. YR627]|uniref:acyltransferase family protein n=1 Tax=Chitinophaga sp. YR627 TaxID=1881041 RepID=UPI0008EDCA61|nr:acyltransferase [Chitinophaga sp. YR627]SFN28406.1 Peptidoglycan/LPS O-acetylase OafA/YrhL, contains acyltransferase and SGNH-hydrolase domains [Chitinophaga sp. YR627]
MTPNTSSPRYFFSLDAIRGFAALIVVLCHWQFYFYTDQTLQTKPLEELGLPLFPFLSIFYHHAFFAVDLFFLLSGFIFFWFYADKIADRKTPFGNFMCYRITRLYPVHLITLIAIALIQYVMFSMNGHTFIIQNNDTYHFLLNFLVIHSWGFEKTPALNGFNGPSWSVSVELLLYLLFFLIAWRKLHRNKGLIVAMIVAGAVIQYLYSMIGQGIYSFFLGGLTYHIYAWMTEKKQLHRISNGVTIAAIILWAIVVSEYAFSYIRDFSMPLLKTVLPGKDEAFHTALFNLSRNTFFRTIISPITILTLALTETTRGGLKIKWMLVLGNASYALYLLHFPLMVTFFIMVDVLGISREVFHSPLTLLVFYAVLIPLSILTHYYFELPIQELFRKRLLRKPAPVAVTAVNNQITT